MNFLNTIYKDSLCFLQEAIQHKCPHILEYETWLLLSDSTPAHWSLLVQECATKNYLTLCVQSPPLS